MWTFTFAIHKYSSIFAGNSFAGKVSNSFNKIHEGVLLFCSKKNKIDYLKQSISAFTNIISSKSYNNAARKKTATNYIDFLISLDNFITINKILSFKDFQIKEVEIDPELCLELAELSPEKYINYNIKCSEESLKDFLIKKDFYSSEYQKNLAIKYKKEITVIQSRTSLSFLIDELNTRWQMRKYNDIEEVNTLLYYHKKLKNISLVNHSPNGYISLLNFANNSNNENHLINLISLIFINYNSKLLVNNQATFVEVFEKIEEQHIPKIIKKIIELKYPNSLINSFIMCIEIKELFILKAFSRDLLKLNKLKPDKNGFSWLLENYNKASNLLNEQNKKKLYNILNKSTKVLSINIENIDLGVINESKTQLNKRIIEETNTYLSAKLTENQSFFNRNNSKSHDLFYKLFEINRISPANYEKLYMSLINLVISNINISQSLENDIVEIKKQLDSKKLIMLLNANKSRLNSRKNIYILSPEIFSLKGKLNARTERTLISSLILKPNLYSKELIDSVIALNDSSYLTTLKLKLQTIKNEKILEYARNKNLIN